jgi:hypothetical protein
MVLYFELCQEGIMIQNTRIYALRIELLAAFAL